MIVSATPPRVVVVGAGPAGMATAIELAQQGVPSVVLEKRGPAGTRENLFNVMPPFSDRLAALDPDGSLTALLQPTESINNTNAVTGQTGSRTYDGKLAPDATRSRGDMQSLLDAMGGADTRRAAKVGIGDLENGLRELARTKHADMIELRSDTEVAEIRQGDGWAEAVLAAAGQGGSHDAVRGAMLVDASGADLLGGPRRVHPEQSHWIGARLAAPADGATAITRRVAVTEGEGTAPTVTIKLPAKDRTIVWSQVHADPRGLDDDARLALAERRAETVAAEPGGVVAPGRTSPVTVQLWTSEQPAVGRVLKVGDSLRAPYFPTSSGAAAALIHDTPRAVDAIRSVLDGAATPEQASAAYADAVLGANHALLAASQRAMLADLGIKPEDAGTPTIVHRSPAGSAASPH